MQTSEDVLSVQLMAIFGPNKDLSYCFANVHGREGSSETGSS